MQNISIRRIVNIAFMILLIGLSGTLAILYVTKPETTPTTIVRVETRIVKVYVPSSSATPPYQIGLGSQNPNLFTKSFSEALDYNDAGAIATTLQTGRTNTIYTTKFAEVCHHALVGSCKYNWTAFSTQLTQDGIAFFVDPYSGMTDKAPYPDVTTRGNDSTGIPIHYIIGQFQNRGAVPMSHYGTAVFAFSTCCGGSGLTYVLESVDLY